MRAWAAVAIGLAVAAVAGAQTAREHASGDVAPVATFRFDPVVGEGWRERSTSVVEVTWEADGTDSTVVDSVYREMTWEVIAATDSGYVVHWRYGLQNHHMDDRKIDTLAEDFIEGRQFALLVDDSGRATQELDPGVLGERYDSLANATSPPAMFNLHGFAVRDWNARIETLQEQEWGQGVSYFDMEEIRMLGFSGQRLFSELWLESLTHPDDRDIARVEIRYFNVPNDSIPVDQEGFYDHLSVLGIDRLSISTLSDFVATGRGAWYIDADRMLLYHGVSDIVGLVHEWPADDRRDAVTSKFHIRRFRRAEPLAQ